MAVFNCKLQLVAPENGGRIYPIHSGYIGQFLFGEGADLAKLEQEGSYYIDEGQEDFVVVGKIEFDSTRPVYPGESIPCRIQLEGAAYQAVRSEAMDNAPFLLLEEGHVVGSGRLVQLADPNAKKTSPKATSAPTSSTAVPSAFGARMKRFGQELAAFFTSMLFLKNFAAMVGVITGLFLLTFWWMRCYTHHGESVEVENYVGMDIRDAIKKAKSRSFRVEVSDSVFVADTFANMVWEQNPTPSSRVKKNRTIYLTITKEAGEEVTLPSLIGNYDYNQYRKNLLLLDMKTEIRERVLDNKYEPNTILYFFHGNEKITDEDLKRGVRVPKGSLLEFVVTERGGGQVGIPNLVCRPYRAAEFLLSSLELNVGTVHEDATVVDRTTAYVYRQIPSYIPDTPIRVGQQIDIYLTQNRPTDCPDEEQNFDLLEDTPTDDGGGEDF